MKPADFRPWAENVIRQSATVARVESGGVGEGGEAMPCGTRVTFATGAHLHIGWVGSAPLVGAGAAGEPDAVVTGPPPEPVKVPDLPVSGRLRVADIERHLAALLNNGGHEEVETATGFSSGPGNDPPTTQKYGLRIRFHDGSRVTGLFIQTLSSGQRPGRPYEQREEV